MNIVVAGGVESISLVQTAELRLDIDPNVIENQQHAYMPMIETADHVAEKYNISRQVQDEYALQSQQRTAVSQEESKYADEIIEVKSVRRIPGDRSKIVVYSSDRRIDAVGACVGMRGSRIQSVVRELNGEKIDIINWSDKPEILISRALAPAKPINLYIDEERPYVVAVFEDEELPMAIGKNGINIKLASSVTEYQIDAVKKTEYEGSDNSTIYLDEIKGISVKQIEILSRAEIHTTEDFLNTDSSHIIGLKGLGQKTVTKMQKLIQEAVDKNNSSDNITDEKPDNDIDQSILEDIESS